MDWVIEKLQVSCCIAKLNMEWGTAENEIWSVVTGNEWDTVKVIQKNLLPLSPKDP